MDRKDSRITPNEAGPSNEDLLSIFSTLKELEKAKSSLQSEYEELIEEHKSTEGKILKFRNILSETSSQYIRQQEIFNQQKLSSDSVTARAKSLEAHCQGLCDKVKALEEEIVKEQQHQMDVVANFESQMEDLKDLFVKAVTSYSDRGISKDTSKLEEQIQAYEAQRSEMKPQLAAMQHEQESLSLTQPPTDVWEEELPVDERVQLLNMVSKEALDWQQKVDHLREIEENHIQEYTD